MPSKTALYEAHIAAGGKIVDFAGWDLPIHYGSQLDEHNIVRATAGMFDVSHMTVVDLQGASVTEFLQQLLANDVAKLTQPGKALYSCMLQEDGGIIDDLIVYYMHPQWFRMVVNAGTREKDIAWITAHADGFDVTVTVRDDLSMLAVQGPQARDKAHAVLPPELAEQAAQLPVFTAVDGGDYFVARTGYTGEDGYEIIVKNELATALFEALQRSGVAPCGLGARDTLRLEAGMNLYGTDMDESVSPLASGLSWTVAWEPAERDFIGRKALEAEKQAGVSQQLVGLLLKDRGVLRGHQTVHTNAGAGETTSGSYAPTVAGSVALARVPAGAQGECEVQVRNKRLTALIVKPPFVRNGQVKI